MFLIISQVSWLQRKLFENQQKLAALDEEHSATIDDLNLQIVRSISTIIHLESQVQSKDQLILDRPQIHRAERAEKALSELEKENHALKEEAALRVQAYKETHIHNVELVAQINSLTIERDIAQEEVRFFYSLTVTLFSLNF